MHLLNMKILKIWKKEYSDEIYETLPVYIRNYFHHPRNEESVSEEELSFSTQVLIDLINKEKNKEKVDL